MLNFEVKNLFQFIKTLSTRKIQNSMNFHNINSMEIKYIDKSIIVQSSVSAQIFSTLVLVRPSVTDSLISISTVAWKLLGTF